MHWIITHYWISTILAVVVVGGLMLLLDSIRLNRKKPHPLPRRKVSLNDLSHKNSRSPLLIRLPKLG